MVLIHQWQVEFCDGNHCAAALLQYFIYWHDIKVAMREKNQQANRVAESHGEAGTQDESFYQFHTREELKAGLLDLYADSAIKKGKDLLVAKGAITVHRNPNPRYTYDNTAYFLLHPDNLLKFLIERKTASLAVENTSTVHAKTTDYPLKMHAQSAENNGTITEITSETPPEITTETRELCKKKLDDEPAATSACSGLAPASDAALLDSDKNGTKTWPSVEALVEMYNAQAPDECPEVPHISPGRRKLATKALRDFPDQSFWERVFRMLGKSPKLRGLRPSPGYENWTADFDWLLAKKDSVENYMKVHDGRYL
jgi:hypothetical protein